jgi:hypothetical protein
VSYRGPPELSPARPVAVIDDTASRPRRCPACSGATAAIPRGAGQPARGGAEAARQDVCRARTCGGWSRPCCGRPARPLPGTSRRPGHGRRADPGATELPGLTVCGVPSPGSTRPWPHRPSKAIAPSPGSPRGGAPRPNSCTPLDSSRTPGSGSTSAGPSGLVTAGSLTRRHRRASSARGLQRGLRADLPQLARDVRRPQAVLGAVSRLGSRRRQ